MLKFFPYFCMVIVKTRARRNIFPVSGSLSPAWCLADEGEYKS